MSPALLPVENEVPAPARLLDDAAFEAGARRAPQSFRALRGPIAGEASREVRPGAAGTESVPGARGGSFGERPAA